MPRFSALTVQKLPKPLPEIPELLWKLVLKEQLKPKNGDIGDCLRSYPIYGLNAYWKIHCGRYGLSSFTLARLFRVSVERLHTSLAKNTINATVEAADLPYYYDACYTTCLPVVFISLGYSWSRDDITLKNTKRSPLTAYSAAMKRDSVEGFFSDNLSKYRRLCKKDNGDQAVRTEMGPVLYADVWEDLKKLVECYRKGL